MIMNMAILIGEKYPNQGQNDGKRSIRIVQALYDEIGKTELNRQVLELQARHLLQDGKGQKISGWYTRGSELEQIVYCLSDIPRFYEMDGRVPKYERYFEPFLKLRQELQKLRGRQQTWKPWIDQCIGELENDLEREKIPKICKDQETKEIYFNTLAGLNEIEEPVSRRIFSKKYLKNSKSFQRAVQDKIISDARKFCLDVDADEEVMGNDEVLSEVGLRHIIRNFLSKVRCSLNLQETKLIPPCLPMVRS